MTTEEIASELLHLLSDASRRPVTKLEDQAWLDAYGLDSLQFLVFRERLERTFGIHIPDRDWLRMRSFAALMRFVAEAAARAPRGPSLEGIGTVPGAATLSRSATVRNAGAPERIVSSEHPVSGPRLVGGVYYDDIEIGMPLTGRFNLAEGPLLQRVGDLRWRHISAMMGVPSREIRDEDQDRLYPTFFYVEMSFPANRPMGAWGENDRVRACSTLRRYGASMLDGLCFLLSPDHEESSDAPFCEMAAAVNGGVPVVRLSNIFVKQFAGAEWLKKSRPLHDGFLRIPEADVAPDSYEIVKAAERAGRFLAPEAGWTPLTAGPVRVSYALVPDRDLNGAGLVYFANYPVFLDICERQVLEDALIPIPGALVDRRTLIRRRSAYLNNASSRDTLDIDVEPWLVTSSDKAAADLDRQPLRLVTNFRMSRRSDGRLMMVSTAEKVVANASIGDIDLARRC